MRHPFLTWGTGSSHLDGEQGISLAAFDDRLPRVRRSRIDTTCDSGHQIGDGGFAERRQRQLMESVLALERPHQSQHAGIVGKLSLAGSAS